MIHQLDPNHPTTTALAGLNKDCVRELKARTPNLDLLSIQMYADLMNLPRHLRDADWTGPYLVTEWGATGHWESAKPTGALPSKTTARPRRSSAANNSKRPSVPTRPRASVPTSSSGATDRKSVV